MPPLKTLLSAILISITTSTFAQEHHNQTTNKPVEITTPSNYKLPESVITNHKTIIDNNTINYTATTGTLPIKDSKGKTTASVFYIAYTKNTTNLEKRPITFCFNGGPGSSSVWLHLGAFGPKRVKMNPDGTPTPPPYELIQNNQSILDLTDLVFIDPVSTGFSQAENKTKPSTFHGVEEDLTSVANFIRLYTTRNKRWQSPKFIAGESYGTTRAAGLSSLLQNKHGMFLNGIILVSAVLDFNTIRSTHANDLPYHLFLPTLATTAHYHKQLNNNLQSLSTKQIAAKAQAFSQNQYYLALEKGNSLPIDQYNQVAQQLANLTSLPIDLIKENNLRISPSTFRKNLLIKQNKTIGRFDSRITGPASLASSRSLGADPSYAAVQGGYTATFNHYINNTLNYNTDKEYQILTSKVRPWNYGSASNGQTAKSKSLQAALNTNPALKVFLASGYYDLATPFYASDYTFNHINIAPNKTNRLQTYYYKAGHMMYARKQSLNKLKQDLNTFYRSSLN